jgi:hypothetical protein
MPDWTDSLADRAAGLVPGFIGANETIEDFAKRSNAEAKAAADAEPETSAPAENWTAAIESPATPAARRSHTTVVKKAAAKKAAAKKRA